MYMNLHLMNYTYGLWQVSTIYTKSVCKFLINQQFVGLEDAALGSEQSIVSEIKLLTLRS